MRTTLLVILFSSLFYSCKQTTTTNNIDSSSPSFTNGCQVGQWPASSLPINLKISSDFSTEYSASDLSNGLYPLEQMAKVWNDSIPSKTFFNVPFSATPNTGYSGLSSYRDNVMGIYKSQGWFSDVSSSALAITQYFGVLKSSAGLGSYIELREADIIVNYRDYNGDLTYSTIPYSQDGIYKWDLQTVVLHEMGHFLGLCHDSGHTSIMKPYYLKTQKSLFAFDKTKITDLYVNNINTLGSSSNSTAITVPEGTEVNGRVELLRNGQCKHYLNGQLVYEHSVNKKGLGSTKAFINAYTKALSKFNKLF